MALEPRFLIMIHSVYPHPSQSCPSPWAQEPRQGLLHLCDQHLHSPVPPLPAFIQYFFETFGSHRLISCSDTSPHKSTFPTVKTQVPYPGSTRSRAFHDCLMVQTLKCFGRPVKSIRTPSMMPYCSVLQIVTSSTSPKQSDESLQGLNFNPSSKWVRHGDQTHKHPENLQPYSTGSHSTSSPH